MRGQLWGQGEEQKQEEMESGLGSVMDSMH